MPPALDPAAAGAGADAEAVEGLMLKRLDSPYLPGRPKGYWFKWKRDPHIVDAVLMYAQRGHGKRSSFYSDYTFGVWTGEGDVWCRSARPISASLTRSCIEIDRFVRRNTVSRFGPVREVTHRPDHGPRVRGRVRGHRPLAPPQIRASPCASRASRRIRWDKPPREADRLETLMAMIGEDASPLPADATLPGVGARWRGSRSALPAAAQGGNRERDPCYLPGWRST